MKTEEALIQMLQKQFILRIDDAYGSDGVDDFKRCLRRIRLLYQKITPSSYTTITAFVGNYPCLNGKGTEKRMDNVHSVSTLNLIVNLIDDEKVMLYQANDIDIIKMSSSTFIYHWIATEAHPDQFYIKGELQPFSGDVTPAEGSFFAVRTYSDLDEALVNYRDNVALMCRGRALAESMTHSRFFFYPAPEDLLQEALNDYLDNRLRNCDVNREHIVDASHPVDIIVRWRDTNHIALIEIKWVGKSLNKKDKIGVEYYDARANEGASQLVGYIDNNSDSFPRDITVGYLVVYDLRRHNNNDVNKTMMPRADANYYKDREIDYDPQYEVTRNDFKKPYRFFIKVSNDAYEE